MVEEIKLKNSKITLFLFWARPALVKQQGGSNHGPSGLSMVTTLYLFIESNKCGWRHQLKVPMRGHLLGIYGILLNEIVLVHYEINGSQSIVLLLNMWNNTSDCVDMFMADSESC